MLIGAKELRKGDIVWTDSTNLPEVDARWLTVTHVAANASEVRVDFAEVTRPVFFVPAHGLRLKGAR